MDTVEKQVSDTILQEPYNIDLGGKKYTIARPTSGTIIEVSKYISKLPIAPFIKGNDEVLTYILAYAKDCEMIGDIAATLILGRKNLIETKEVVKKKWFGLIKNVEIVEIDNRKRLSKELLDNCSNEELLKLISEALGMQHVAFFFSIITTLNEANILRATKKAETKTTASGL